MKKNGMKLRKQAIAVVLSTTLLLGATGCGSREENASSGSTTMPASSTTEATASSTSEITTQATTETTKKPSRIGEVITIGELGGEPVEWFVVDEKEDALLLVSRYLLHSKPYNDKYDAVTWETCTLRKWMNEDFFTELFNEKEREKVLKTKLQVQDNPGYGTPGGNPTEDYLFLLSLDEVAKFFPSPAQRECKPTKYAIENKVWEGEGGNCYWWLISPGFDEFNACMIDTSGFIGRMGYRVHNRNLGIRPAFWMKTEE